MWSVPRAPHAYPAPLVAPVVTTPRPGPTAPRTPPPPWPPPAETSLSVYLPREWKRKIKAHCASEGVTISAYVLALIAKDRGL